MVGQIIQNLGEHLWLKQVINWTPARNHGRGIHERWVI